MALDPPLKIVRHFSVTKSNTTGEMAMQEAISVILRHATVGDHQYLAADPERALRFGYAILHGAEIPDRRERAALLRALATLEEHLLAEGR